MKKTSYIIIALCALALIVAVAAPAVVFEKVDIKFNILKASGEPVRIETGMFVSMQVSGTYNVNPDEKLIASKEGSDLIVRIHESDSVKSPVIVMDKTWADNVRISNDCAGMTLDIDLHSLRGSDGSDDRAETLYGKDELVLADITVPRDMLHRLPNSMVRYELSDFDNSSLSLYRNLLYDITGSRFGSLTLFTE